VSLGHDYIHRLRRNALSCSLCHERVSCARFGLLDAVRVMTAVAISVCTPPRGRFL
jgi:hypothetical protein